MPRKRILKVVPDPQPKADVAYAVQITASEPLDDILRVTVRHLRPEMNGFTRVLELRLPLTPSSPAAGLFRAAGVATAVGAEVDPKAIVDAVVTIRFALLPGHQQLQPVAFEPAKKEDTHAQ